MPSELMTMKEIEGHIGVTNVDSLKWKNATYVTLSAVRACLAMFEIGGAVVAVGGMIAPFAAFIAALCAIGLPAAKAKEIVGKKGGRHGYAIGLTLAAFGYGKYFASTFIDNTSGHPGVAPAYMTGIYKTAYNTSLVLGYCSGNELTVEEKNKLTKKLTEFIIRDAKKGGYKVYMDSWSDRDWVLNYARVLNDNIIKD